MKIPSSLVLAAGAAALLVGAISVASAAPLSEVAAVTVRYDDLNLNTDQGNSVLYQRIVFAAEQVCGQPDIRELAASAAAKACKRDAIARAVNSVHSSRLAAIYTAHLPRG